MLMDIDPQRLEQARSIVQATVDRRGIKATVKATTDRRVAVENADYVVTTFQQGGLDAYKLDIEIPQKYGVEQCVGDTLGPGGVFRALRTIPVLLDLCDEMDELAPDALLLNTSTRWPPTAGQSPRAGPAAHWALPQRPGPARCWPSGSACRTRKSIFSAPASITRFFFLEFCRGKEDLLPAPVGGDRSGPK